MGCRRSRRWPFCNAVGIANPARDAIFIPPMKKMKQKSR